MPRLIKVFQIDPTPSRDATSIALDTLAAIGPPIVDYTHLVLPAVTGLFEIHLGPDQDDGRKNLSELAVKAMQTTGKLVKFLNLKDYSSRLFQPLLRVLEASSLNHSLLTSSTSSLSASTSAIVNVDNNEQMQQVILKLLCDVMDNCSSSKDEYSRYYWFDFLRLIRS